MTQIDTLRAPLKVAPIIKAAERRLLRVMISYVVDCTGRRGDKSAERLKHRLEREDFIKVLFDTTEIQFGGDFGVTINQMVRTCDVMVPYISDGFAVLRSGYRSDESSRFNIGQSWTLKEVQAAVRSSKQVVPVWHSGPYPPENLVVELGALQYIKMKGDEIDSVADKLVQQLRRLHTNLPGNTDHFTRTSSRHNIHSDQPVGSKKHQPVQQGGFRWTATSSLVAVCIAISVAVAVLWLLQEGSEG